MDLVITLFVAGAILLVLETILPGMIAGAVGLLCVVGGVIQSFIVFGPQTGSYILIGVLAALILGTMAWFRYFPETRLAPMFASQRAAGGLPHPAAARFD